MKTSIEIKDGITTVRLEPETKLEELIFDGMMFEHASIAKFQNQYGIYGFEIRDGVSFSS